MLLGFLSDRRLTLEMKCAGLDAAQMARQSVPPSDMSLLGLLRHLTSVENYWFEKVIAGVDGERLYEDGAGHDLAFVVEPDPGLVDSAWSMWRSEVARSDLIIGEISDLEQLAKGKPIPFGRSWSISSASTPSTSGTQISSASE